MKSSPFADQKCPKCGYALTGLPTLTCPECGSTFDVSLIERARRRERRRQWLRSACIMAIVMYAPLSWVFLIDYHPWTVEHSLWMKLLPILPGVPVTLLLRFVAQAHMQNWGEFVCMGAFTLAAFWLFTWLGTRGKRWLIITAVIVLALSCYNGWVAYILYRL